MAMLHFNDNANHIPRDQPGFDPLFKVRPVLNTVLLTCETVYSPERHVTVDEGTVGWRGNLSFRVCTQVIVLINFEYFYVNEMFLSMFFWLKKTDL